jgi:hypothetical protein
LAALPGEAWDYACNETADEFFHDGAEHLSQRGRVWFSVALAAAMTRWLEGRPLAVQ